VGKEFGLASGTAEDKQRQIRLKKPCELGLVGLDILECIR
jgi:hypothetical protein